MFKAVFTFPNGKRAAPIEFPDVPRGMRLNNQRPGKCVISGDHEGEDIHKVTKWIYGHCVSAMHPKKNELYIPRDLKILLAP